jgi:hypothetical protein
MIYTFVPNETKNIVRSDDKNYIRNLAMLKTYRKATDVSVRTDSVIQKQSQKDDNRMEFVVNDSIVYTNVNQFKSPEGLKLWQEMHKLSLEDKILRTKLTDLRTQYSNVVTEKEKSEIAPKILELEVKIREEQKQISLKTIQIRNAELKSMQNLK